MVLSPYDSQVFLQRVVSSPHHETPCQHQPTYPQGTQRECSLALHASVFRGTCRPLIFFP